MLSIEAMARFRNYPKLLLPSGVTGAWYDPSDLTTLFQDTGFTTPVTAHGQNVRGILDKSGNGFHGTYSGSSMVYETDGALHWIRNANSGAYFTVSSSMMTLSSNVFCVAGIELIAAGSYPAVLIGQNKSSGMYFAFDAATRVHYALVVGGTAGNVNNKTTAAIPLTTKTVLSQNWDNTGFLSKYRDGKLSAFEPGSGGTIGSPGTNWEVFGSGTFTTNAKFYGLLVVSNSVSKYQRDQAAAWMARKTGVTAQRDFSNYVVAIGDSTVGNYSTYLPVMDYVTSVNGKTNVAIPSSSIAQQKAKWLDYPYKEQVGWVIVQVGLNDLNPAIAASVTIAALQDLVDTVISGVAASCRVFISKMTPCRQRLIDFYGAVDGPIAYQKWLDINSAIAGSGATPITGVYGRITSHEPLMNDGSGNLAAAYDVGDHIHENTSGRQLIATEWTAALVAAGVIV